MDEFNRLEALKEVLEDLKNDISEYPGFDELNRLREDYLLLIAIENYIEIND